MLQRQSVHIPYISTPYSLSEILVRTDYCQMKVKEVYISVYTSIGQLVIFNVYVLMVGQWVLGTRGIVILLLKQIFASENDMQICKSALCIYNEHCPKSHLYVSVITTQAAIIYRTLKTMSVHVHWM